MEENVIYIKVLNEENEWLSSNYFNGNAYPANVQALVNSCWRRFSLILTCYRNIKARNKVDIDNFLKWLNLNIAKIRIRNSNNLYEVSYESVAFISNFYMTLFMTKSFLDIWAKTCASLIVPESKIKGFHKAKIGDEVVAGGKFIHWLQINAPQTINIKSLAKLVYDNVKTWINDEVKYRDQILHHGEVKHIKPLRIIIKEKPKTKYEEKDLLQASMPDDTLVLEYCRNVVAELNCFIIKCIRLLPNISYDYLSLEPLIIRSK